MAQYLTPAVLQVAGSNSSLLAGAKMHVYESGTTTPVSLYSDEAMTTPASNPLVADSLGIFPVAFLAETAVKVVITTSADVAVLSRDPVYTIGQVGGLAATQVTFDGSQIGFAATNVQEAIEEQAQAGQTPASTTTAGALRIATTPNVWAAASGNRALVSEHLSSAAAFVALSDASTISWDWQGGINFTLTVAGNRTLGNPTNGIPGTDRTVLVKGNSSTNRTLSFGNQYGGTLPTLSDIDDTKWYRLVISCISTSHFIVAAQDASEP